MYMPLPIPVYSIVICNLCWLLPGRGGCSVWYVKESSPAKFRLCISCPYMVTPTFGGLTRYICGMNLLTSWYLCILCIVVYVVCSVNLCNYWC